MTKNKSWDVTPERLAFLLEACNSIHTCGPESQLEALEFSLAKWHESRSRRRGRGPCGCCKYVPYCSSCPLDTGQHCCNGLTGEWSNYGKTQQQAEAVYQFILGKYWEEKERLKRVQS